MSGHALAARLAKLWRRRSATITEEDPTFNTVYLGNTVTQWAKGEGCVDKPLATLWRNYCQSTKQDIRMQVTVSVQGLKATTRQHGLTEYWSHRITHVQAHPSYPRVLCWVYRHEGRKMKPELRCHAVLCRSEAKARRMQTLLTERLHQALHDFRKQKQLRQNARLSVVSVLYPSTPCRRALLADAGAAYRPPLERSKSAPKLNTVPEERLAEEAADRELPTRAQWRRRELLRRRGQLSTAAAAAADGCPSSAVSIHPLAELPDDEHEEHQAVPGCSGTVADCSGPASGCSGCASESSVLQCPHDCSGSPPTTHPGFAMNDGCCGQAATNSDDVTSHRPTSAEADALVEPDPDPDPDQGERSSLTSEQSTASVPSDPAADPHSDHSDDSDNDQLLLSGADECAVYRALEQLHRQLTAGQLHKPSDDDAASSESGYSEPEPAPPRLGNVD